MSPHSSSENGFVIDIFPRHITGLKTNFIITSLESGFSPDSYLDDKFSTGLHLAAAHEEETDAITVAEILLKYGANPNIQRGVDGRTSLHISASMGHMRLLDLLMRNGGDPLLGDIQGLSVVDIASSSDQPEVVLQVNQLLNTENFTPVEEEKFTLSFKCQEVVDVLLDPHMSQSEESFHTATENGDNKRDGDAVDSFDGLISSADQQVAEWCANVHNDFQETGSYSKEDTDISDESSLSSSPYILNHIKNSLSDKKLQGFKNLSRTDSRSSDVGPLRQCLLKALIRKDSKPNQGSVDTEKELFSPTQQDIDLTLYEEAQEILQSRTLGEDSCFSPEDSSCMFLDHSESPLDKAHLNDFTQDTSFELSDISNRTIVNADNTNTKYRNIESISHKSSNNVKEDWSAKKNREREDVLNRNGFKTPNIPKPPKCKLKSTIASTITVNTSGPPSIITVSSTKSIASIVEEYVYKDEEAGVTLIERRCPSLARIPSFNGTGTLRSAVKNFNARESHLLRTQDLTPAKPSQLIRERMGPNGTPLSILDCPNTPSMRFPDIERLGPMGTPLSILDVKDPWHIPNSPFLQQKKTLNTKFTFLQPENKLPVHLLTPTANVAISVTHPTPFVMEKVAGEISSGKGMFLGQNNETACTNSTLGTITESIGQMSVNELRHQLQNCGMINIGPIVPCTQRVYQRHLLRLRKYPDLACESKQDKEVIYPREIKSAIEERGNPDWSSWAELEQIMSSPFKSIDPSRHWRDGNGKTCFNYLLLDPRITMELPLRGVSMTETEKMKCFISSVFYIGKGSRGRPYHHMYAAIKDIEDKKNPLIDEALKKKKTKKNKKYDSGAKIKHIQEIWEEGLGVVSLHIFQNTIPVEAWTREAAMISAIGLDNLTNSCQGTYYGPVSTWRGGRRRQLGAHLLHLALNILMYEGERQLRPDDVPIPTWWK